MRERPILFNADMVRAVLDGRKMQTRRIVKWRGLDEGLNLQFSGLRATKEAKGWVVESQSRTSSEWRCQPTPCPFGEIGDRLWVRETWAEAGGNAPELQLYRASYPAHVPSHYENVPPAESIRWRPSIHMPRWASRITLEITGVRVERLHAITLGDICKELGCGLYDFRPATYGFKIWEELWQSIYGADSWQANPWVWVIEFKRAEGQ